MPIMFNTLLEAAGIAPKDVRLLRHADKRAGPAKTVYRLWREDPTAFERYQSHQSIDNRANLDAAYWASFVLSPDDAVLFVGLYRVLRRHPNIEPHTNPLTTAVEPPDAVDAYTLERMSAFDDLSGLLTVEWGPGLRGLVQRADNQNKRILELRTEFKEPVFPGYAHFVAQLSEVHTLPASWCTALGAARGIYLLTCPTTNEQYVGSATGADGFLGRWLTYAHTGHGGNVALKSRDASDYRISILEVVGSGATTHEIELLEALWKRKLQSREMGLNRN